MSIGVDNGAIMLDPTGTMVLRSATDICCCEGEPPPTPCPTDCIACPDTLTVDIVDLVLETTTGDPLCDGPISASVQVARYPVGDPNVCNWRFWDPGNPYYQCIGKKFYIAKVSCVIGTLPPTTSHWRVELTWESGIFNYFIYCDPTPYSTQACPEGPTGLIYDDITGQPPYSVHTGGYVMVT